MLSSIDESADRIEAAGLALGRDNLAGLAHRLRHDRVDVFALYDYQREIERLLEGIKSAIEHLGYQPARKANDDAADDGPNGRVVQQWER